MSEAQYFSFLLRMWVSSHNGQPVRRLVLEDTRTGKRLGFSSLRRLCEFLEDQGGLGQIEDPARHNG